MNDLPPVYRALRQLAIVEPMPDWAVAEPSPYSLLPTSYSHFAASPTPDWAVVELPMHVAPAPEYPETRRMLASRLGWWRLVNGYSGFTPARQPALGQQLADFPSPGAMEALRELGSLGVRYLVVHPGESPYDRARWQAQDRYLAERNTTLRPVGTFGPDELYFINPCGDELITHPADSCTGYGSPYAPVATGYYFADQGARLRLLAYLLEPALGEEVFASRPQLAPATVRLTLYWQTSARLAADYTVFVHSLDDDGQLIGQADGLPVANGYPTTTWKPGEIVQDSRLVPVGHSYLVGLYDASTGERLPVFAADGGRLADDAVRVAGTSDE
jgi:hypothetical protein